jgi:hypothetical protein
MPVTKKVKTNVTMYVTNWEGALRDAEEGLRKAQRAVASWKATIQTCRRRMAERAPWPGAQSEGQDSGQQHNV